MATAPVRTPLFGAAKSANRPRAALRQLRNSLSGPVQVLDFEADAAEAGYRAALERAGTPIGPYDVLIAAQARSPAQSL